MPAAALADGFVRVCFDTRGIEDNDRCILAIEGQFIASGSPLEATPDVPVLVTDQTTINDRFGSGSILSEALKVAFRCCGNRNIDIYAIPRTTPTGAGFGFVAYQMDICGTATTSGVIDLYLGGPDYKVSVPISAGATPVAIRAAIVAAIGSQLPDWPYQVAPITGAPAGCARISITARNRGAIGRFLYPIVNPLGYDKRMPGGVTLVNFQMTSNQTGVPAALNYDNLFGSCCVCCFGLLTDGVANQNNVINFIRSQWSCDRPQCFGHAYTWNAGTAPQILAQSSNSPEITRLAFWHLQPPGLPSAVQSFPVLPWLLTAAYAALSCCAAHDNPELSIEGPVNGLLKCLDMPATCRSWFTWDEQQEFREEGFATVLPEYSGRGAYVSPYIANDTTNFRYDEAGRKSYVFRSVSSRRLAARTAISFAQAVKEFQGVSLFRPGTTIPSQVRGITPNMLKARLVRWIEANNGVLFSRIDNPDKALRVVEDIDVANKCEGVPGRMRVEFSYQPPVKIEDVITTLAPRVDANC